jgi:hypothetical protein
VIVNRVLTVLIASVFAAGSGIALAQAAPGTAAAVDSNATVKQQKSEAFADRQSALEEQSRSSASGAVTTGDDSNVDKPVRSGNKAKDFAERERAFSKASRSSASGHNKATKTPRLTQEERSAIQRDAEKQRAEQSRR